MGLGETGEKGLLSTRAGCGFGAAQEGLGDCTVADPHASVRAPHDTNTAPTHPLTLRARVCREGERDFQREARQYFVDTRDAWGALDRMPVRPFCRGLSLD